MAFFLITKLLHAPSYFSNFCSSWILYFRKPAWLTEQTAFSLQVGRLNRLGSGEPPIQRTRGKRTFVRHRKARPLSAIQMPERFGRLTQPQRRGESSHCHAKYLASDKLGNWRICAGARTHMVASAVKRSVRRSTKQTKHVLALN